MKPWVALLVLACASPAWADDPPSDPAAALCFKIDEPKQQIEVQLNWHDGKRAGVTADGWYWTEDGAHLPLEPRDRERVRALAQDPAVRASLHAPPPADPEARRGHPRIAITVTGVLLAGDCADGRACTRLEDAFRDLAANEAAPPERLIAFRRCHGSLARGECLRLCPNHALIVVDHLNGSLDAPPRVVMLPDADYAELAAYLLSPELADFMKDRSSRNVKDAGDTFELAVTGRPQMVTHAYGRGGAAVQVRERLDEVRLKYFGAPPQHR